VSPDRVAPAEDTREWTLIVDQETGLRPYAVEIGTGEDPGHVAGTQRVEVVEKSALTAAVLAREEAEREREHFMVAAKETNDQLEADLVRAESQLQEALDLIEKAAPACEVKHWSGAGEHPVLGPLSREMQSFLRSSGRLPE